ncbi:MAG: PEP/pyruvate-binding domain-containing protein, partial [Vicinamibacterales bacterium]
DGFVIPAGVQPAIGDVAARLLQLGDVPVAVRSSGLAEDLAEAAFAGQYDTVLNVRGAEGVLAAASAVVASAQAGRLQGYAHRPQAMAVLVQQMVDPDASGVAFSANPLTGNRDEVRISATRGLADQLVSGGADADEWLVTTERATSVSQPHQAIDPELAGRIATLARRAEAARQAPQDIEWALAGDRLWLLQARPITALPVAPVIATPVGTWLKDAAHFAEPLSPFAASTQFRYADEALDEAVSTWGLLVDRMRFRVIGHEPYVQVEPDDGGKQPPPWWVLAIAARVVPSLRRKLRAAAAAVDAGRLEAVPSEWMSTHRPRLRAQIEQYARLDLVSMDHASLFDHVGELSEFYKRSLQLHFMLFIPHAVGLYELAATCEELLGWDLPTTIGLLQGLSATSTASTDELVPLSRRAGARAATRALLAARSPDALARLADVDPELFADVQRYLQFWGLRPLGPEPGCPTVAERPGLVTDLLADLLDGDDRQSPAAARATLVEKARTQLEGPSRRRFDVALAYAERVYALREDNVLFTDQLPVGLLRRAALECGRRMVQAGLMSRPDDAVLLTIDELRLALETSRNVQGTVQQRKAEHAWVRANPGPTTYGPEPGRPPDLRGLPAPARRINDALLWAMAHELVAPPAVDGDAIAGIGVSPGLYRGRVRVIRAPEELDTLRAGEVLVCPTTQAAWMMVFQRAGAIVAETGSVLSHTAIIAREFGLPAVVAAAQATTRLRDGEEVVVDGTTGIVRRAG